MDRTVEQVKVEKRHLKAARDIAEAYLIGRYGPFASIEVLRRQGTVGWEGKVAEALARFEQQGYQEAVDSVADWSEPEPPDHSWRD